MIRIFTFLPNVRLLPEIIVDTCMSEKVVHLNLNIKHIAYDTEFYYNEGLCEKWSCPCMTLNLALAGVCHQLHVPRTFCLRGRSRLHSVNTRMDGHQTYNGDDIPMHQVTRKQSWTPLSSAQVINDWNNTLHSSCAFVAHTGKISLYPVNDGSGGIVQKSAI